VTLDGLQKGDSRTQDYTRKTQQIAETRKQVEAEAAAIRAEREQYAQLFGALQQQLSLLPSHKSIWSVFITKTQSSGFVSESYCVTSKRNSSLFNPNSSDSLN